MKEVIKINKNKLRSYKISNPGLTDSVPVTGFYVLSINNTEVFFRKLKSETIEFLETKKDRNIWKVLPL